MLSRFERIGAHALDELRGRAHDGERPVLTPREHEIILCDENVEEIDFDVDADIVGVTPVFFLVAVLCAGLAAYFAARNQAMPDWARR